ncbi:fluoride efflux transporter FluC [Halobellus clavatus]|uniref:Fluoride-specific ion channel FluC n=1 Tax=Halobellus clavatus TaxID=660517 RepID=A0A1H3GDH2_9EURY|nr:CrcB family protein [Halobellus clavatus]SDY01095.1 CrcB protein [Halobellus clavatus]
MTAWLAALPDALLVGVGGSLGALARYGVDVALDGGRSSTFAVNVVGSIALGALVTSAAPEQILTVAGAGFCGAFTTFSSFAVNVSEAAANGRYRLAAIDAAGTLVTALVGVGIGAGLAGL